MAASSSQQSVPQQPVSVDGAIAFLLAAASGMSDEQADVHGGLSLALEFEGSEKVSHVEHVDLKALQPALERDIAAVNALEKLLVQGKEFLARMYTHRSCTATLAEVQRVRATARGGGGGQSQLEQRWGSVVAAVRDELNPVAAMAYDWHVRACLQILVDVEVLARGAKQGLAAPTPAHMWCILRLIDMCLLLDIIKHSKPSLRRDVAWWTAEERQMGQGKRQTKGEDATSFDHLEDFFSTRWAVLRRLRRGISSSSGADDMFAHMAAVAAETVETGRTLLFVDRLMLLRVLPPLLLLAAPTDRHVDTLFRRRGVKRDRILSLFKREPLVHAYGDISLVLSAVVAELSPPLWRSIATAGAQQQHQQQQQQQQQHQQQNQHPEQHIPPLVSPATMDPVEYPPSDCYSTRPCEWTDDQFTAIQSSSQKSTAIHSN